MAKINFTKEHFQKLEALAFDMLISNRVINTKMGMPLNIVDLMHTQTINTLNSIRLALGKQIEALESQDEWVATDLQQEKLNDLKNQKDLVNLIIGWKRFKMEEAETKRKKEELTAQLNALKESQKTPEDRIKEIQDQIEALGATSEEF